MVLVGLFRVSFRLNVREAETNIIPVKSIVHLAEDTVDLRARLLLVAGGGSELRGRAFPELASHGHPNGEVLLDHDCPRSDPAAPFLPAVLGPAPDEDALAREELLLNPRSCSGGPSEPSFRFSLDPGDTARLANPRSSAERIARGIVCATGEGYRLRDREVHPGEEEAVGDSCQR